VKTYQNKSPFQGVYGIHADSCSKSRDSKAYVETYRTRDLHAGVGLASKDSWLTNMNSWLKPREERAVKMEMERPARAGPRSQTKSAKAPWQPRVRQAGAGARAGKSRVSPGQDMPGVKREPKSPVPRSRQGTPETFVPVQYWNETRNEIGSKLMPRVMPGIGLMANPKGCPLPVTLLVDNRR
jgi:hypothetical protein